MRIGVIGAGGQGRVHAAAYARNPGVELVSVAGRNPTRARALADEHGTTAATDAAELLEDPSIEAVSICTPTHLHRDLAVAALEQGKHVLCETPLSASVADVDAMRAAAEHNGRLLLAGLTLLGLAECAAVRDRVRAGDLGQIKTVATSRLAAPFSQAHYGDALSELMLFDLDLLNWIFDPPRSVAASGVVRPDGAVDHAFAALDYDGVAALCEASRLMPASHPFRTELRVVGEEAALRLEFEMGGRRPPATTFTRFPNRGTPEPVRVDSRDPYAYICAHFVRCIRGDEDPELLSAARARQGLRVVAAIRTALHGGGPVQLDEID